MYVVLTWFIPFFCYLHPDFSDTLFRSGPIEVSYQTLKKSISPADTDSESGAEASDLEGEFSESEEELEASAQKDEPQAATSGGGSSTWGPPQGRNIKIHLFVGPAKA